MLGWVVPAFFCIQLPVSAQVSEDPFRIMTPKKEALHRLPVGVIKAEGWLQAQILQNMNGFTGHLDSLAPDLMVRDDIYGKNRISRKTKPKELGAIIDDEEAKAQLYWWNSETQSNLWDGYLRSLAALPADKAEPYRQKAQVYVDRILSYQDADGYLGIYDTTMRYRLEGENGELWAQATLLRGLLAWYEFSGDKRVLTAVEKAVANVMLHYPAETAHPFYSKTPYVGGTSHGLAFTDVLEHLYHRTGEERYRAYAVFLYRDFSSQNLHEDAQLVKLTDSAYALTGHGVHTYEHLRSVAAAAWASGNPNLLTALAGFEAKVLDELTPSGAPVGDEWIGGHKANATETGYEYCSLQELLHSYGNLLLKTGQPAYADRMERLFLNAAQGARHPTENAIAYLKTDNSYRMDGRRSTEASQKGQVRYKYSPVHRDAAVCCVPNAGRITPYFVEHLWLRDDKGLVAPLLGPCRLETTVKGIQVRIHEQAWLDRPDSAKFTVEVSGPAGFAMRIRKPTWAAGVVATVPYRLENGYLVINRTWTGRTAFSIRFQANIQRHQDRLGETFFTYGPLVLAHPLAGKDSVLRTYSTPGFRDLAVTAAAPTAFAVGPRSLPRRSSKTEMQFQVPGIHPATGKVETLNLMPFGGTVLRQTTFPSAKKR